MNVISEFEKVKKSDAEIKNWPQHRTVEKLVELAVLAYNDRDVIESRVETLEGTDFTWFETVSAGVDTQAFAFVIGDNIVVAFRGTKEIRDFLTDVMAVKVSLRGVDHQEVIHKDAVHYGFRRALDAIWSTTTNAYEEAYKQCDKTLVEYLEQYHGKGKKVWFTGHSLGGALANVAAARIALSQSANDRAVGSSTEKYKVLELEIGGLVTIGAPRVLADVPSLELEEVLGDDRIFRIYKSIDPVPLVPAWGYDHVSGRRCFVTRKGDLVIDASKASRMLDRALAWVRAIEDAIGTAIPGQHQGVKGLIADHNSDDYLQSVKKWESTNKASIGSMVLPILTSAGKTGGAVLAALAALGTGAVSVVEGAAKFL